MVKSLRKGDFFVLYRPLYAYMKIYVRPPPLRILGTPLSVATA